MTLLDQIDEKLIDFNQTILANSNENDYSTNEAFCNTVIDVLSDEGECSDYTYAYFKTRGQEISGYSFNDDNGTLELFYGIFNNYSTPSNTPRADIENAFTRMINFFRDAVKDQVKVDPSNPAYDMASHIKEISKEITVIRLFVLTDGTTTITELKDSKTDEIFTVKYVWDIRRILNLLYMSDSSKDIHIDFDEEFGQSIECLSYSDQEGQYQTLLLLMPGDVLAKMYLKWQYRIMERNVRAFLQFRGKVNQGIRDTISNEPEMFLAYNNGLSALAESVELVRNPSGQMAMKSVEGLQIVNGGQTTASVFNAYRDGEDSVKDIVIQTKLVVANPERMDEISPNISRFSNTQNPIQDADFGANDSFHRRIEQLSRDLWAPAAVSGSQRQSQWFYERSRGQYKTQQFNLKTDGQKREFSRTRPQQQMFTKVQLAQADNTWKMLPQTVCLGPQKNFAAHTDQRNENMQEADAPDSRYFHDLIAKLILFRQTQKSVVAQKYGGQYTKINITIYTLSYLNYFTENRLDLDKIWREQSIDDNLEDFIVKLSAKVLNVLESNRGLQNFADWCREDDCWENVKSQVPKPDTESIKHYLGDKESSLVKNKSTAKDLSEADSEKLISEISEIPSETWFSVAKWARESKNLQGWQRSLAYSLGQIKDRNRDPSVKQALQGHKILDLARKSGYRD